MARTVLIHEAVPRVVPLAELKARLVAAGWSVSVGSWDETLVDGRYRAHAFSVEGAGPATYGHSAASLSYTEDWKYPGTGWVSGRL